MNHELSWVLELEVKEGRGAELKRLAAEMIEATKSNEAGTLAYEWSLSADQKRCHVFERYADSKAVLVHLDSFGARFATRFWELVAPIRITLTGRPDAQVKAALAPFDPVYLDAIGGFTR